MKRALIKKNILLLFSIFALFLIAVLWTLFAFEKHNRSSIMTTILSEVELEYTNYIGTPLDFVERFQTENGRRITLLSPDGLVIADSHDVLIGTDKSLRPEIVHLGEVFSRESETIGVDLLYIATLLDDGNYLRVALPLENQAAAIRAFLIFFLLMSFAFIVLNYFGLCQVNKHLLSPWDKVIKGLSALNHGNYEMIPLDSPYPEINELVLDINNINYETKKYLKRIETYQLQLKEILNSLKQGVLLFDNSERLIYFNDDAKQIFLLSESNLLEPSYLPFRDNWVNETIHQVNQTRKPSAFDLRMEGKIYEVNVFPIDAEGVETTQATVLALFREVTQERAMEQIKKDFFSHASHELKSPLTAIRGLAELIENHLILDKDLPEAVQKIIKQTDQMTRLVEDMLMLSRLENLKEKPIDTQPLQPLLEAVIEQLSPLTQEKRMTMTLQVAPITFVCDPLDFQKLFKNIIENSLKYSDPGKEIQVTLSETPEMIHFEVKDQGIGISQEHQQRIFERFYRVDKGRLDDGTGLGLAIVKHIVLKYNGTIDLKSSLNKGTTLSIHLMKPRLE